MIQNYKPYLGLPARLSQVWLNRWTLLLVLVFFQLLSTAISLKNDLDGAKREALAACTTLEKTSSVLASVPHYMAGGMNAMTTKGIEASVAALGTTTNLMLTGVEELVLFMINTYKNTYLCLFTFAVRGSLQSVIGAAEDTVGFLNSTLSTIERNILSDAASAQTAVLGAVEGIVGGIGSVFGAGNVNIPRIDIPSASQLLNITIPDTIDRALQSLNNSLPTFDEVKNATDTAIKFPFELLKQNVRSTLDNFTFNSSLLPVPPPENLRFCSDSPQLNDFFQSLVDSVHRVLMILAIVTLVAALLAMVPYAALEWWSWRTMRSHAKITEEALQSMQKPDFLEILQILCSPISYKLCTWLTPNSASEKRKRLVRWLIAYLTYPPALLVLAVSLALFISCIFQAILLSEVQKAVPVLLADVSDMQALISTKVQNASAFWITGTNKQLSDTESQINENLFGWARESTASLNNTLNTFVDTTVTTVKAVFGNTPLEAPVLDVLNCVILMKVEGIQKGLTFVNEHARVQLPRVDNSTVNTATSAFAAATQSSPAAGQGLDSPLLDIITRITDKWNSAIRQQTILAGCVMSIYGIVTLMGLLRVLYASRESGKTRGEGGGLFGFPAQRIAWARYKFGTNRDNPFEDPRFEREPGPTPSIRTKK